MALEPSRAKLVMPVTRGWDNWAARWAGTWLARSSMASWPQNTSEGWPGASQEASRRATAGGSRLSRGEQSSHTARFTPMARHWRRAALGSLAATLTAVTVASWASARLTASSTAYSS